MSVHKLVVHHRGPAGGKHQAGSSPISKSIYLRFDNDTDLDFTATDLERAYRGKVEHVNIEADANESAESKIRDLLSGITSSSTNDGLILEIRDEEAEKSWMLSLKRKNLRLVDFRLTLDTSLTVVTVLSELVETAVHERNERETALAREMHQLNELRDKNREQIESLMRFEHQADNIKKELLARFLGILNTKKRKIGELQERIAALEKGEDDGGRTEERAVQSGDEEDEEAEMEEQQPVSIKVNAPKRKEPSRRGRPPKNKSEEADRKNTNHLKGKRSRDESATTDVQANKKMRAEESTDSLKEGREEEEHTGQPLARVETRSSQRLRNSQSIDGMHAIPSKPSSSASASASASTSKVQHQPITEDEYGPLPAGWEVTTSRTTGKRTYSNRTLKRKQFKRPEFDETDASSAAVSTTTASNVPIQGKQEQPASPNPRPKRSRMHDDDDDDDPASRALKGLL